MSGQILKCGVLKSIQSFLSWLKFLTWINDFKSKIY